MEIIRFRVRFSISGRLAYLSHLDVLSAVEKAIRRSSLPIRYSEGFNPHMILSWGPAHGVGVWGDQEWVDFDFVSRPASDWVLTLNEVLPDDLQIQEAFQIPLETSALMACVQSITYEVFLQGANFFALTEAIGQFLIEEHHPYLRISPKGNKEIDLRPLVEELVVFEQQDAVCLRMTCRSGPGAIPKPAELVKTLAPDARIISVCRKAIALL